MAINPMKKKATTAFFAGVIITLLIVGVVGVAIFMLMSEKNKKQKAEEDPLVNVCVLSQDVASGQKITNDMFTFLTVKSSMVPGNAQGDATPFMNYSLTTSDGKSINTDKDGMYLEKNNIRLRVEKEVSSEDYFIKTYRFSKTESSKYVMSGEERITVTEKNGNRYIKINDEDVQIYDDATAGDSYISVTNSNIGTEKKEYIKLSTVPLIAKIKMRANTVLTLEMVAKSNEQLTDDVRRQEYNCIILPIDLTDNQYVDIRLMLPTGQDYIVLSKKNISIPVDESGNINQDTIWMNVSEDELLTMSSAIVEAYRINGAKLYATVYTDPGMQAASTPTYQVNNQVAALINNDPNIVEVARRALSARYNSMSGIREGIESNLQSEIDTNGNYQTHIQESITKTKEDRQNYLQSLNQY